MRKLFSVFIVLIFISISTFSQWRSSDIPDTLKKNADVVVRRYVTDIKVVSLSKKITTINQVITILNEKGKDFADFQAYYDKNTRIEFIKGMLYNDFGKIVKKISMSDFKDVSIMPDYTLFDDNRMKYYQFYPTSYPYTVEYECRVVENNILSLPSWCPISNYRMSVEDASLRVNLVDSSLVRYKIFNIDQPTEEKNDDYSKVLIWEVHNLKSIEKEPFSPRIFDFLPVVLIAPIQFRFEGYDGSMQNWQKYGEWISNLLIGRQDLSLKAKSDIQVLTSGARDTKDKVKLAYKYLQSHSRYVSIQLGIGGFQPFPASDVEKNGYGDCKALTNYTRSLLDVLGVKSYYCEIGVNNSRITFDDFPSINQTDHAFLCVPIEKDTLWLECTSQNSPFGFVSHDIQNQKVILVDGNSSRLVNTPKGNTMKNIQTRIINIQIDSLGFANGEILTNEFGAELENLMPEIWSNKKDQLEIIQRKYRVSGIIFNDFEYQLDESTEPKASEKIFFKVKGYASRTGRRLFVPVNPFVHIETIPSKSKKRLTDVVVDECYTHIDTLTYSIPKGYDVEFIPKSKSTNGMFGSHYTSVRVQGDKIIAIRQYQLKRGKYEAKKFNDFVDFLLNVSKQDNQSIVLIKK